MSYYSCDSINYTIANYCTTQSLYPTEFLNTIHMSGLLDHHLQLKVGVPIMLLRNMDPTKGLCNRTSLIVTQLTHRIIEAQIITWKAGGTLAYIPRILCFKWPQMTFQNKASSIPRSCFIRNDHKQKSRLNTEQGWYVPTKACILSWLALCRFLTCYISERSTCPHWE